MCLSYMSPLITMVGKAFATIFAHIWPLSSMSIDMIIELLPIGESFATMITFVLAIFRVDVSLLDVPFFPADGDHQATNLTRNSGMGSFDVVIQMVLGLAYLWAFWTFLQIFFMVDFVM